MCKENWKKACLVLLVMACGCGKGERFQQSMPMPERSTAAAAFAATSDGDRQKLVGMRSSRQDENAEGELVRSLLDEPATGAVAPPEGQHDAFLMSKLSEKERILVSELTRQ